MAARVKVDVVIPDDAKFIAGAAIKNGKPVYYLRVFESTGTRTIVDFELSRTQLDNVLEEIKKVREE